MPEDNIQPATDLNSSVSEPETTTQVVPNVTNQPIVDEKPQIIAEPTIQPVVSNDKRANIKKYFLYIMIGGLIISALISIMAVLIGEFNEFVQKSLLTTFSVVFHSLIALGFVSVNVKNHSKTDETILDILFAITVASFATSVMALWEILTGSLIGHLYLLYLYAVIALVICRALLQANRNDSSTRMLANGSIIITAALFVLLMPSIFVEYPIILPDVYYRFLGALSILLGTTAVLTAIMNRLYINKQPKE